MKKTLSTLLVSAMLVTSLTACGEKTETPKASATPEVTATPAAETPATLEDGTFEGAAQGMKSEIKVSVTVKSGKITEVKILSQDETPEIYANAKDEMPKRIVEANSADVDVVANATMSSTGIKEAVKNALAK